MLWAALCLRAGRRGSVPDLMRQTGMGRPLGLLPARGTRGGRPRHPGHPRTSGRATPHGDDDE